MSCLLEVILQRGTLLLVSFRYLWIADLCILCVCNFTWKVFFQSPLLSRVAKFFSINHNHMYDYVLGYHIVFSARLLVMYLIMFLSRVSGSTRA